VLDGCASTLRGAWKPGRWHGALVLSAPGTNRDHDVAFALELAGAEPRLALLAEVLADPTIIGTAQMLVVASFSLPMPPATACGRCSSPTAWATLGLRRRRSTGDHLQRLSGASPTWACCPVRSALRRRDSSAVGAPRCLSRCVWTRGPIECPIAHGGRYVHRPEGLARPVRWPSPAGRRRLGRRDAASASGVVLGLMLSENHVHRQHLVRRGTGRPGLAMFQQGVRHAKEV
jgi:hypothetical protein